MNAEQQNSWQPLLNAGLVSGSPPPSTRPVSPWYVRLMLGGAGWLAALFLLAFVASGLGWLVESDWTTIATGLMMIGVAWLLLKRMSANDFAVQFALAISFAGQALVTFGLYGLLGQDGPGAFFWLLIALLQAALAALMPNPIHRLWSSFATGVSLYMALQTTPIAFASSALILAAAAKFWSCEFRWPRKCSIIRPIAYGLVLALVALELASAALLSFTGVSPLESRQTLTAPWLGQLLTGAVLLWVVWRQLRRLEVTIPGKMANSALIATAAIILISLQAPGIATGLCIVLLGFGQGNRILTGIGICALLLYAGSYYYNLDVSLLVKSQVLAATGAAMLLLRWLMLRWLWPAGETGNA